MDVLNISAIKAQYPDEWVLIGNPTIQNTSVLSGVVLYHSKDKKEVCYSGKPYTEGYERITITFTGKPAAVRRIGVLR